MSSRTPSMRVADVNSDAENKREVEQQQRLTKIVAEYEYKLLQERGRAQERETRLLEEMQRREESHRGRLVSIEEHERVQQELEDTRMMLQEAEHRHLQEKRELLKLRTLQLRSETSRRGQEDDVISRVIRVMSEYEAIVRSSEEGSVARLSQHMDAFEKEWVRRSREFEEQKAAFEEAVMEKTQMVLGEHERDVETISQALLEKMTRTLRSHSEARVQIEGEVLRHAEIFREEYKGILDKEFRDRCKLYDEKLAERERGWLMILQEEHNKIIMAEQQAMKEHEASHVKALEEAMRDLSQLREELLREHQEQQTEARKDLVARRESLQREHEDLVSQMSKKMSDMQHECAVVVEDMQEKMRGMHIQMATKEAEMAQRLQEAQQRIDQAVLDKTHVVRSEVEKQWTSILEKERVKYKADVQKLASDYQATIDRMRAEQTEREGALLASYEQRVVKAEETTELRWSGRVEEATRGLERHMEVIQKLRRDNENMSARIESLTQEVQLRAAEVESAVGRARREQDDMWRQKTEYMRQRHDKLLNDVLGGGAENGDDARTVVSRQEYEAVLSRLKEWEEKCVTLKQNYELCIHQEREQLNTMWAKRLDEERKERKSWEYERLQMFAGMREAFLRDMEKREECILEARQAERDALHKTMLEQQREERRRKDEVIDKIQREANEKCAAVLKEQERIFQERASLLEERMANVRRQEEDVEKAMFRIKEEAQRNAIECIQQEREVLQATYEKKFAELYSEQQRWEVQRSKLREEIVGKYAEQFEKVKANMEQHVFTVVESMLLYQAKCETEWLQQRKEELEIFHKERMDYRKRMRSCNTFDIAYVRRQMEERIKIERTSLEERERVLHETLNESQRVMENEAAEHIKRVLEEQQRVLAEATRRRIEEQQQQRDNLQIAVLEETWRMEELHREEIQQMQRGHEIVLQAERQQCREVVQKQQEEMKAQERRLAEQLEQQHAALTSNHASASGEEREYYENKISELRKDHECRLADEKKRMETLLRERETSFDAERRRLLESMEKQSREQQESNNERVRELQEKFDSMVRTMTLSSQQEQEKYMRRVAELQQEHLVQLEEQETELQRRYDASLGSIHAAIEMRLQERVTNDMDVERRVEERCAMLSEDIEAKYISFMQEQTDRVKAEQQMREEKAKCMERMYHDHLAALRNDMEETFSMLFAQNNDRAHEASKQLRAEFEKNFQTFRAVLDEEQKRRTTLEEQLREAHKQIDALNITHEQQKLEVLREVQGKYEKLYREMYDALRAEREEQARCALGEEEARLLRELTARGEGRRRHVDTSSPHTAGVTLGSGRAAHFLQEGGTPVVVGGVDSSKYMSHEKYSRGAEEDSLLPQQLAGRTPHGRATDNNHVDELLSPCGVKDDKLRELWSVMELPEEEQQQTLRRWSQLPLPQRAVEVRKEARRLELQLPILEIVTRREFVMHRLKEIERAMCSSTNSRNASAQEEGEREERELRNELLRLTQHLKSEIPRHESMYGCTFRFRGVRYMDSLLER